MQASGGGEQFHEPKRRSKWRKLIIAVAAVLLIILAAGGGGVYYGYRSLQPTAAGEPKTVVIPSGAGSADIAAILEEEGIIRSKLAFTAYLRYKKQGDRFQAGQYELSPGMKLDEITDKLNRGDVIKEEMLRFTIPEGYTVLQIADKLSQEGLGDRGTFLTLMNETSDWSYEWLSSIPADGNLRFMLEGYLFPETYEMKKGSTEKDIVGRMLAEWENKAKELPDTWQTELQERNMTFHQMLTVASLVEREVAVDEERALVAGVIYNRMKQGMALQIDATVQYLFETPKERLFEKDLQIESPYNTYLNAGLPPGPIASPGLASIKAALWPEKSGYLFYVTKKDGSGRHLFAETYEGHKQNIARSTAESE